MGIRKNQSALTATEKAKFVAAVIALKTNGRYDQYVQQHAGAMMAAHRGPAFLPWHREFLRRLELDLQMIDPGVTLPYWDWTVDNSPTASLWADDFMGPNGRPSDGQVMTGPFAFSSGNWPLPPPSSTQFLARRMAVGSPTLPTVADVAACMSETPYDSAPWNTASRPSFRNRLEGWISTRGEPELHNRVHVWVGGSMLPMTSPNDPIFFLHHCNIDRLWAQWQTSNSALGYVPTTGALLGHNLNDPMQPWGGTTTVASVLNHRALGYCYDTEPGCVGKTKELKLEKIEIKELKKEKLEKPERKELKKEKLEKLELKEWKREKIEQKEWKEKEFKERKPETLEFEKGLRVEVKQREFVPTAEEPVAQRVERLEEIVEEMFHFIGGELRPELGEGALSHEPDLVAVSEQLEKQAADAKQAKDTKDVEKPREV